MVCFLFLKNMKSILVAKLKNDIRDRKQKKDDKIARALNVANTVFIEYKAAVDMARDEQDNLLKMALPNIADELGKLLTNKILMEVDRFELIASTFRVGSDRSSSLADGLDVKSRSITTDLYRGLDLWQVRSTYPRKETKELDDIEPVNFEYNLPCEPSALQGDNWQAALSLSTSRCFLDEKITVYDKFFHYAEVEKKLEEKKAYEARQAQEAEDRQKYSFTEVYALKKDLDILGTLFKKGQIFILKSKNVEQPGGTQSVVSSSSLSSQSMPLDDLDREDFDGKTDGLGESPGSQLWTFQPIDKHGYPGSDYKIQRRLVDKKKPTLSMPLPMVLAYREGLENVTEFLASEHSTENIQFWQFIKQYHECIKNNEQLEAVHKMIGSIFIQFIDHDAINELNIPARLRADLIVVIRELDSTKQPPSDLFDPCLDEIFRMMNKDSFPRFKSSPQFKTFFDIVSKF
jgi:hypothetical protein